MTKLSADATEKILSFCYMRKSSSAIRIHNNGESTLRGEYPSLTSKINQRRVEEKKDVPVGKDMSPLETRSMYRSKNLFLLRIVVDKTVMITLIYQFRKKNLKTYIN